MKLLVATPLYPPDSGGPATYAKLLFEGLPLKGIEVELVKFGEVRHLPKGIRHLVYFWRVYRAAKKVDVVLALDPVSVGVPASFAAKLAGKPFVVKVVGDYAWEQGQQRFGVTEDLDVFVKMKKVPYLVRALRRLQTFVAKRATRCIVPSRYLKKILETWGIPSENITVVYNAVPLEEEGKTPEIVSKLAHPLVVTAGRLVPWKHIDGVIDAVAATTNVSLVIVGDGPERAALEKYAQEKIPDRSVFTGTLTHKDTLAAMRSADVFVLNSSYEGLSHLLIEAQALGLPIVACRVGGNEEVIMNGESGLLIDSGDTSALTQAIVRILSDGSFASMLSRGAQESAKRFSIESMLDATVVALNTIAL